MAEEASLFKLPRCANREARIILFNNPRTAVESGMHANRREFLQQLTIASATTTALMSTANAAPAEDLTGHKHQTSERPLIISTWPFGKPSNERAREVLNAGGTVLDAVEKGINVAETDPNNHSVGFAGLPNADGFVQLDACIMDGPTHKAGSVAALERILMPVSVARRVMEKTPHVMLAGEGARQFALKEGFKETEPVTASSKQQWESWKAKQNANKGHDTIALIALGADGNLAGGCSTSGLAFKLNGRVGDSPIIGSGLYVDNDIGGAGATGVGENIMRFCGSFMVVEFMRQGLHPTEACIETIKRIMKKHPDSTDLKINFIAINKHGDYGAAGTGQGFQFAVTSKSFSNVLRSPGVTPVPVGAIGGNRP
jgi:N4-(beta-N-acetylglucosaminyl)-L-asparaginase